MTTTPAFRARVMAGLFAAGGTLSLSVGLFPLPNDTYKLGYYGVGAIALGCALMLRTAAERMPVGALPFFAAIGTACISLDIYFSAEARGGNPSDIEMLYLWVALYAAYFFTRAELAVQLAWMAVSYWLVLAASAGSEIFATRWVQTVLTLGVGAFLLSALRDRVSQLVTRLTDAARTDALTGLQNRRGFEEQIALEVERARRYGRDLSVVVGDLDHFKRINDRFGHPAGDAALVRIGELLTDNKRQVDAVARTGGEEFALILPDTGNDGALIAAERLRAAVEKDFEGDLVHLTFSLGVATYPQHGEGAEELIVAADQALYAAKQLGRNRSVMFSDQIASLVGPGDGRLSASSGAHLATLLSLAEALDVRDTGTSDHSHTVGSYCEITARELGLPPARVKRVRIAGLLHDVGKIGLPDSILRKAGPLNDEERAQMRRHPEIGAGILGSRHFDDIRSWILAHHERPDGKGYPLGLSGEGIPLEARILAVADAYEAMTADRVYRPAIGRDAAQAELRRCSGTQFDKRVVEALLAALSQVEERLSRPARA